MDLCCPRSFTSEGSRSFKTHVIDDHQVSEDVAQAMYERQNNARQSKAMAIMREQRLSIKIKKSAIGNKKLEVSSLEHSFLHTKGLHVRFCSNVGICQ